MLTRKYNRPNFQIVKLKRGPLDGTTLTVDTNLGRLDLRLDREPLRYVKVHNRDLGTIEYHESDELYRELRKDTRRECVS